MDKLIVLHTNDNKSSFISAGYAKAFRNLRYFVYERNADDISYDEIKTINPEFVFCVEDSKNLSAHLIEISKQNEDYHFLHYFDSRYARKSASATFSSPDCIRTLTSRYSASFGPIIKWTGTFQLVASRIFFPRLSFRSSTV